MNSLCFVFNVCAGSRGRIRQNRRYLTDILNLIFDDLVGTSSHARLQIEFRRPIGHKVETDRPDVLLKASG